MVTKPKRERENCSFGPEMSSSETLRICLCDNSRRDTFYRLQTRVTQRRHTPTNALIAYIYTVSQRGWVNRKAARESFVSVMNRKRMKIAGQFEFANPCAHLQFIWTNHQQRPTGTRLRRRRPKEPPSHCEWPSARLLLLLAK